MRGGRREERRERRYVMDFLCARLERVTVYI